MTEMKDDSSSEQSGTTESFSEQSSTIDSSSEQSSTSTGGAASAREYVPTERRSVAADLGGLCRLSSEAVHLTTKVVEAQHSRLDWFSNLFFSDRGADRARNPIAALVYNSIYTVNSLVGTSLDFALSSVEPLLGDTAPSQRKEAALAILNGVVGDYLEEKRNPLAISMQWRTLPTTVDDHEDAALQQQQPSASSSKRFLLLIHGSCNSPQDWWQEGHNHGIALADALGYTPLFLHYNTGLHISDNGLLLAQSIGQLIPVGDNDEEISITIIAHSMGGLVARSACYYAAQLEEEWLQYVDHFITLGSPHHGAMLERGGKLVDAVLGAHRFTEPLSWLGKIRSKGVTDLGYGNVREEDWLGYSGMGDFRKPTPLPIHPVATKSNVSRYVRCMAVAAVMGEANSSRNRVLGESIRMDGLVTEASALGRGHTNPEMNLEFAERATFYNLSHFGLLSSNEVYEAMLAFLTIQYES
mmetsp:Transcript_31043/g.56313  ORF Transcript_31043/g.56313 Transcript_31043/m.56313 type:complete len:471 (-) Transcript_31043:87-1499(-)